MPTNARQFVFDIRQTTNELPERAMLKLIRAVAFEALGRIVRKTPVDTGRARGNWQVGIDQVPTGEKAIGRLRDERGRFKSAKGLRDVRGRFVGEKASLGASQSLAEAKKLSAIQPFSTVFITNNLPYIERLEAGWSKKAPTGMVVTTVAELQALFR